MVSAGHPVGPAEQTSLIGQCPRHKKLSFATAQIRNACISRACHGCSSVSCILSAIQISKIPNFISVRQCQSKISKISDIRLPFDYSELEKNPACSCSIEEILAVAGDIAARESKMAVHFMCRNTFPIQCVLSAIRISNFPNFISVSPKFRKYATSDNLILFLFGPLW